MEAIIWGHSTQQKDWYVVEEKMPGFIRVYWLESGRVQYESETEQAVFLPGNLYLLPSHRAYRMEHDIACPFRCVWVHFYAFPLCLERLVSIRPQAGDRYDLLTRLVLEAVDTDDSKVVNKLMELLVAYGSRDGILEEAPGEEMGAYIRTHYREQLTITGLAARFGYSEAHFIRRFRDMTDMTPYQYLMQCRLDRACLLLRKGVSVEETADQVGYADGKSLGRAFRRQYGRSPSEYRRYHSR